MRVCTAMLVVVAACQSGPQELPVDRTSCANFPLSVNACLPFEKVPQAEKIVALTVTAALKEASYREVLSASGLCLGWSNNIDLPASFSSDLPVEAVSFSSCELESDGWQHSSDGKKRGLLLLQCVRSERTADGDLVLDGVVRAGPGSTHGFTATISLGDDAALKSTSTTWGE